MIGATLLLLYGVRESARVNTFMVAFKVAVLGVFIVLGATAFDGGNLSPFTSHTAASTPASSAAKSRIRPRRSSAALAVRLIRPMDG